MTTLDAYETESTAGAAGHGPGLPLWRRALDPDSPVLLGLGLAVAAAGFLTIAVGWSDVAGLSDVWRQMPYILSAGLPGIGLVMTGLVMVNAAVRRQEAVTRDRQLAALTEAIRELRESEERG